MSVRVKRFLQVTGTGAETVFSQTEYLDSPVIETTVDGQTFAWGPNQARNFIDDGVGIAHAAFASGDTTEDGVIQDPEAFGDSRA